MKYFVLGAFSSAFFLYGIALVYGATGTTNLVGIFTYLSTTVLLENRLLLAGMALLLVGLGFKVALVPFHWWTPDVYQGAPTPVTGFFASAPRSRPSPPCCGCSSRPSAPTARTGDRRSSPSPCSRCWSGAVVAIVQTNVKRMLAYSSISHAGFILVGVEVGHDRRHLGRAALPAGLRRPRDRHASR